MTLQLLCFYRFFSLKPNMINKHFLGCSLNRQVSENYYYNKLLTLLFHHAITLFKYFILRLPSVMHSFTCSCVLFSYIYLLCLLLWCTMPATVVAMFKCAMDLKYTLISIRVEVFFSLHSPNESQLHNNWFCHCT